MKWLSFWRVLILLLGFYVTYQGFNTYTFGARSYDASVGIYKFGIFIPATDYHLHTYGLIFMILGVIISIAIFIRPIIQIRRFYRLDFYNERN